MNSLSSSSQTVLLSFVLFISFLMATAGAIAVPTGQPSGQPTTYPTWFLGVPSPKPTRSHTPTRLPTPTPTRRPTAGSPTNLPGSPTFTPSLKPSTFSPSFSPGSPTASPSPQPTSKPTAAPSSSPTPKPTFAPTYLPGFPTPYPSALPTQQPSAQPTQAKTRAPTAGAAATEANSPNPDTFAALPLAGKVLFPIVVILAGLALIYLAVTYFIARQKGEDPHWFQYYLYAADWCADSWSRCTGRPRAARQDAYLTVGSSEDNSIVATTNLRRSSLGMQDSAALTLHDAARLTLSPVNQLGEEPLHDSRTDSALPPLLQPSTPTPKISFASRLSQHLPSIPTPARLSPRAFAARAPSPPSSSSSSSSPTGGMTISSPSRVTDGIRQSFASFSDTILAAMSPIRNSMMANQPPPVPPRLSTQGASTSGEGAAGGSAAGGAKGGGSGEGVAPTFPPPAPVSPKRDGSTAPHKARAPRKPASQSDPPLASGDFLL